MFYRTAKLTKNFITEKTEDFEDRKWIWEHYGTAQFGLQVVSCCFSCLNVSGASPTMHAKDEHKLALHMPNCLHVGGRMEEITTKQRLTAELLCRFP